MKNKSIVFLFIAIIAMLVLSGCAAQSKEKAIIGEWAMDAQKSGTTDGISYLKFDANGDFEWLMQNETATGTVLYTGTYIPADTLSIYIFDHDAITSEYSFEGNYLKIGGMYYKKSINLHFTPTT